MLALVTFHARATAAGVTPRLGSGGEALAVAFRPRAAPGESGGSLTLPRGTRTMRFGRFGPRFSPVPPPDLRFPRGAHP
jgi:hypothetical protein